MRLALFQPDIPQNAGALLRLAACLGVAVDLIEPLGFVLDDRRLKRALMDYAPLVAVRRHASWEAFCAALPPPARIVLLTTAGETPLPDALFGPDDVLLLGRESAGVPDAVHAAAALRVRIPMRAPARSLNVALAGAIALGEALRQLDAWPRAA